MQINLLLSNKLYICVSLVTNKKFKIMTQATFENKKVLVNKILTKINQVSNKKVEIKTFFDLIFMSNKDLSILAKKIQA